MSTETSLWYTIYIGAWTILFWVSFQDLACVCCAIIEREIFKPADDDALIRATVVCRSDCLSA